MRSLALLLVLVAACDPDDHHKPVDASVAVDATSVDAPKPIDAAVDAAPDAPNADVVTACMHACDAIGVCLMMPTEPDCYTDCQDDLADCTAEQVAKIDACSTEMCGDIANEDSPLVTCIMNVPCVSSATAQRPTWAITNSRK